MQSERKLIQRIVGGDRGAYAEFVDIYGPRVHRLVRRYTRSECDAEDLTQEIFLDLYRGLARFRGDSALGTWVYQVAVNHCLKHQERRKPETVAYDDALQSAVSPGPVGCVIRQELADQIGDALDALAPLHRDVVILHELYGLTYAECARALDVPIGTVKSRLSNAFRRLRASLGGYVLSEES